MENQVVVRDINMSFKAMVIFKVKWAIATIPAALILMFSVMAFWWTFLGIAEVLHSK
jgi:hypothetical protein